MLGKCPTPCLQAQCTGLLVSLIVSHLQDVTLSKHNPDNLLFRTNWHMIVYKGTPNALMFNPSLAYASIP